jgi:SAM-dependent methyltransferase
MASDCDALVAEGAAVPLDGWDFSWFDGRATEERPPWGYARLLAGRLRRAHAALDIQTGGGEVLSESTARPSLLVATESWAPNRAIAGRALGRLGACVVAAADDSGLPFRAASFDLVVSRHPTVTVWSEISRVLQPGGVYFSQQVGAGSVRELTGRDAAHAGLVVANVRTASLRIVFYDVGAVTHFLRKVPWIVPGFSVERDRDRLAALHERIETDGCFVAHAERFLIEAHKPVSPAAMPS